MNLGGFEMTMKMKIINMTTMMKIKIKTTIMKMMRTMMKITTTLVASRSQMAPSVMMSRT